MSKMVPDQFKTAARTSANMLLWITAVLIVIYLVSGVYSVANNEVGVLQFFGKIVDPAVKSGIHYALPWPFYRIDRVPTRKVAKLLIEDFSQSEFGAPNPFTYITGLNTYAVTGDNNLINLACVVQYKIDDPVAYLFNLRANLPKTDKSRLQEADLSVKLFLKEMACSTLLDCLSRLSVDHALTNRDAIVSYVKKRLQNRLDAIDSGLAVLFVEIKGLKPPMDVQEYFADVIKAQNDKIKAIRDAESYYNEELPAAKGRAARLLAEGEAYYSKTVLTSKGEANRFLKQLGEYQKDRALTRYRLYMEAIQEILPMVGAYHIVDTSHGKKPVKIRLFK